MSAGLLVSYPGARGGYALSRAAARISVWDVVQGVEDDPRPVTTWVLGLRAAAASALRGVERAAADRDRWPEFAVFDCYSCHHAIQSGSVYETQDPPGKPGDLPLDLAPLKVLLVAAGDRAALDRFGEILSKTFPPGGDARAFGRLGASTKELMWFANSGHVLAADAGRAEVIATVGDWLDRHVPPGPP